MTESPPNGRRSIISRETLMPIGALLVVAALVWHAGEILRDMNAIITESNQSMLDRVEERYVSKEVFNLRMDALEKNQDDARAELAEFRKEFKAYVEGVRPPR